MSVPLLIGGGLCLVLVSRLVRTPPIAIRSPEPPWWVSAWRGLSLVLLTAGLGLYGVGMLYGGLTAYLAWRERVSPSTERVLVLQDGREVPLAQPAAVVGNTGVTGPLLPPQRIEITRIGAVWPVVLSEIDHLPRFKGVGWLMGSAFPGAAGNIVLFGQYSGPYATFARLAELAPGDEITLTTEAGAHVYRVRRVYETTADDVGVLAPTTTATATLITLLAEGANQTDARYLIVTADHVKP